MKKSRASALDRWFLFVIVAFGMAAGWAFFALLAELVALELRGWMP